MKADATSKRPEQGPAERLLAAADRLFYEQGYAATGVNELMREAGVAKASFYHHFPSKEDLVVAYLSKRADDWFAELTQAVDAHSQARERVLAVFDFLEDWLVRCNFRGCAFLNTIPEYPDPESPPRRAVREAKRGLHEYVRALCASAGQPEAGDEVFVLVEGVLAHAAAIGEAWPAQVARQTVSARFEAAD